MTIRLEPGEPAPDFALPDDTGATRTLSDFAGRRLILFAYPAALTPGCTLEATDFRDHEAALDAAGFAVVGVSPDKPTKLARFRDAAGLHYPLLSDPDREVLTAYGAYGEKQLYGRTVVGVIRSTFVIDAKGKLELVKYAVKATGHVARLMTELGVAQP